MATSMTAPSAAAASSRGSARGVWGMTGTTTTSTTSRTRWGHYDETYDLGADGVWRIRSLRLVTLRVA
jgi:hypothetical protein